MLNPRLIRDNPDVVREALRRRGIEAPIDEILELDERRRSIIGEVETLRAERNRVSSQIGRDKGRLAELRDQMKQVGERIKGLEESAAEVEQRLNQALLLLPNNPHESVPPGESDRDNVVVRSWGEPRAFDFPPRPHWELGEMLDIIDLPRAAKLSGARFYVLKGEGARLQRALITFFLDVHTREHGYTEIYPPYLVRSEVLVGSGHLPKHASDMYHDAEDDLWLLPTSEVYLVSLHRDEILEAEALPLRYTAYTACFRRERVAAGRDVRGIKRVLQFDKVEMVRVVEPETSYDELESLVGNAETIFQRLGLPYQVMLLCTGDLGFAMAKTYDINVWAPGSDEWLECSSCSNAEDYQARRANIRYRRGEAGKGTELPHTLNGSGVALPRTFASILENYQQADGSVVIPEVLRPYMGGLEVIRPR